MKHLFFIDPLEKLNIKKDSSLMMALTFRNLGGECYLLFENDFYIENKDSISFNCYTFSGSFKEDGIYLAEFKKEKAISIKLDKTVRLHMRIDPPFDTKYLRYLWMLDFLKNHSKIQVSNNPNGIMINNEKLIALALPNSLDSFIGSSYLSFEKYLSKRSSISEWILKPLDLFSGIGVSKHNKNDVLKAFKEKVTEFHGAVVAQPFLKDVYNGEIRSIYFKGEELGTILKVPPKGSFLSNIAQGAEFKPYTLSAILKDRLKEISMDLLEQGVELIAYDILGDSITEINITCPGLLVEVSSAHQKNLCENLFLGWNR